MPRFWHTNLCATKKEERHIRGVTRNRTIVSHSSFSYSSVKRCKMYERFRHAVVSSRKGDLSLMSHTSHLITKGAIAYGDGTYCDGAIVPPLKVLRQCQEGQASEESSFENNSFRTERQVCFDESMAPIKGVVDSLQDERDDGGRQVFQQTFRLKHRNARKMRGLPHPRTKRKRA